MGSPDAGGRGRDDPVDVDVELAGGQGGLAPYLNIDVALPGSNAGAGPSTILVWSPNEGGNPAPITDAWTTYGCTKPSIPSVVSGDSVCCGRLSMKVAATLIAFTIRPLA